MPSPDLQYRQPEKERVFEIHKKRMEDAYARFERLFKRLK